MIDRRKIYPVFPRVIFLLGGQAILAVASISHATAADRARDFLGKPDAWFQSDAGRKVVGNVLSFQTGVGDWPKNTDCVSAPYAGDPAQLHGTFDNSATTEELRFLARAINATHEASWEAAFHRGLDHILAAQYQNGGWPQSSPPGDGYDRYITFNDDTMVRLMNLLHDVVIGRTIPVCRRRPAPLRGGRI